MVSGGVPACQGSLAYWPNLGLVSSCTSTTPVIVRASLCPSSVSHACCLQILEVRSRLGHFLSFVCFLFFLLTTSYLG